MIAVDDGSVDVEAQKGMVCQELAKITETNK